MTREVQITIDVDGPTHPVPVDMSVPEHMTGDNWLRVAFVLTQIVTNLRTVVIPTAADMQSEIDTEAGGS